MFRFDFFEDMSVKGFFKGVWQFCSYLFWPRWGGKKSCAN